VHDYTIFLRAYRIGVFKDLIDYFSQHGIIQSSGFIANSELLTKISLFSKRIKEIPFIYDYGLRRGKSKMKILHTIGEYFVFVLYMRYLIRRIQSSK
jgi:dolichol-phosphate mannosyltransferase